MGVGEIYGPIFFYASSMKKCLLASLFIFFTSMFLTNLCCIQESLVDSRFFVQSIIFMDSYLHMVV